MRFRNTPREKQVRTRLLLPLAVVVLALAATTWSAARTAQPVLIDQPPTDATMLAAPLPQPSQVTIQRRTSSDGLGNILITVTLSPDQLAAKQADGTQDFVTLGHPDDPVILRDDGQGGDAVAHDGVFTGIGNADDADLQARASSDQSAIGTNTGPIPSFVNRVLVGNVSPRPFDYNSFNLGKPVVIGFPVVFPNPASPTSQFQDRVLMIRDPAVVTDPNRTYNPCTDTGNSSGVWTFNHVMTEMANQQATGIDPRDFVEDWLLHWVSNQTINTVNVPSRPQMQTLINLWKNGQPKLDLRKSPLRLLAIVPRLDLRHTAGGSGGVYHASGHPVDGGEARFVFGFVLRPGWSTNGFFATVPLGGGCNALRFSVITEFRVPKCDCKDLKGWAQQWVNLAGLVPGTAAYNEALEDITEQFVRHDVNPNRPNNSDLGQLRTNEVALDPTQSGIWELREFQLPQFHFTELGETNTQDTPIDSFNNTATLLAWIRVRAPQEPPEVPLFFQGAHFLGAHPQPNPGGPGFFWTAPGVGGLPSDNQNRFHVGFAACNGCHTRDTGTNFVHVDPGSPTLPANLSGFLTGITVTDPVFPATRRTFHDLLRREADIIGLTKLVCGHFCPADRLAVRQALISTGRLPVSVFPATCPPVLEQVSVSLDDMSRSLVLQTH
jgi:hypothetical protein